MKKNFYILSMCMLPLGVWAQSKQWSLTDCINYAVQHNISVKKTELNQQTAEINLSQAKDNRLPTVSGSASANLNNGSAINQISNERVSQHLGLRAVPYGLGLRLYETLVRMLLRGLSKYAPKAVHFVLWSIFVRASICVQSINALLRA